ncbi:MAG: ABC transporter ATP-binding protein [Phycisphaerales bacterium]|nr:ABC transporter ATP-binding protein [Phycisphaerales bacterium]
MIEAHDLTKSYGRHAILRGASLKVPPGERVILTGDNGSGKTTLLHVLVGLRRAESGRIVWNGTEISHANRRTWCRMRMAWGFLPQHIAFPSGMPVGRLLRFHARLRNASLEQAHHWLDRVGLAGTEKKHVDALSGGMRQRLGIALTLFFDPMLIIMDEPASSLDPGWRGALAQWTDTHAARGAAVLVTSQLHESWGSNARHAHCVDGRIIEKNHSMEVSF